MVGKTDFDLFSKEQANALRKNDKQVLSEGKTLVTEEEITLPNGDTQYFEVIKTPLRDVNGHIVGLIGNSVEITNRVKALIAKEEAELANESKNQFIANMEHDLRTPCAGIAQMVKALVQKKEDGDEKESLEYVLKAANRLLEILNGILEFDRIESGRLPVLYKKLNLKELVDEIVAIEIPSVKNKHLDLSVKYATDLPEVFISDAFRVSRILLNLVSNAIKFTDNGYIKIFVEKARKLNKKHMIIRIKVEDTGIGIPKDKQDVIYTRFSRLHPSNEEIYKGSGLGLSIVKQFIEELEGEIEVKSTPGRGTTFECLLPFEIPLLTKQKRAKNEGKIDTTKNIDKNLKILFVEDNPLVQKATSVMLQDLFTKALDEASNGKEALELSKQNKYDLIFMDIGLPDFSGYEVTKRIRQDKKNINNNTIIVALTAHDDSDSRKKTTESGMNDFLVKPIDEEKILNIITRYLRKKPKETSEVTVKIAKAQIKSDAINIECAAKLIGGDSKSALELISMLVQSLPSDKNKINDLAKAEQFENLGKVAHKLHGAVSYCGTIPLKEAVKTLELAAKNEEKEEITKLVENLNQRIEEVLEAYNAICGKSE